MKFAAEVANGVTDPRKQTVLDKLERGQAPALRRADTVECAFRQALANATPLDAQSLGSFGGGETGAQQGGVACRGPR